MPTMSQFVRTHIPQKALTILFCVGMLMVTLGILSIVTAERWMPDNAAGQQGILAFYRAMGPFVLAWGAIAAWCYAMRKSGTSESSR